MKRLVEIGGHGEQAENKSIQDAGKDIEEEAFSVDIANPPAAQTRSIEVEVPDETIETIKNRSSLRQQSFQSRADS